MQCARCPINGVHDILAGYRTRRLSSRRSFIAAAAGISIASVGVALPARSAGVFYPGTSVHGIDIGGLDRSAAETMLRQAAIRSAGPIVPR